MTLRHLRFFTAVCRSGYNVTKAAQMLHASQPAVSLAIRELEEYYGVRLFERMSRRLRITDAGRRFLAYAQRILSLFDDMERELRSGDALGLIRVGASMTIGTVFLPEYVREFNRLKPGVDVRATVGPTHFLESRLLDNSLDLALVEGAVESQVLVAREYMKDNLVVICPARGRYKNGQEISLGEFAGLRLALREEGSGTREIVDREAGRAGISLEPVWEAASSVALLNAVKCGLASAVMPLRLASEAIDRGEVVPVRVRGLDFIRGFYIVHHREKLFTPLMADFVKLCVDMGKREA